MKRARVAASLAVLGVLAAVASAPAATTEATWADPESGTATFTAATVPAPAATLGCVTTPGALGLDPRVTISWRVPASATGYSLANAEFGYLTGGVLLPLTSVLLGNISTSGTATSYTTVASGGLLGGLLGGSSVIAIRFIGPGDWRSHWLTATATMGALGANPTCTLGTAPSV